ncbi:GntR family transcriptional regulator [Protaetiibacter sp. SSC-01]|uniref:GntR family transcriptional regulator n=1 Tax=Protaetiibacter sp. SSC-01 TaxID=2759943 RepID=UPI00165699B2|nr:GntR family transcriptional regulator [Protaetiibacter sp. SSC-01]QNO38024.1 GntR family transcriptional regulator [Protaetiibacter sp. SSC-01]
MRATDAAGAGATGAVRPDAVVASLRTAILAGTVEPGSAVTEALVSETFGVARPTARIAIDRLVSDGILEREPHHAARVKRLGRDDIADLFAARAAVESAAVELLAGTARVPADASAAHERLLGLEADASYWAIDLAFHRALVQGAPSTRLPRLHDQLMGEIEFALAQVDAHRLRSTREVAAEHGRILDAVAAGDAALAEHLTRSHILASRDRLLAHFDMQHGR